MIRVYWIHSDGRAREEFFSDAVEAKEFRERLAEQGFESGAERV